MQSILCQLCLNKACFYEKSGTKIFNSTNINNRKMRSELKVFKVCMLFRQRLKFFFSFLVGLGLERRVPSFLGRYSIALLALFCIGFFEIGSPTLIAQAGIEPRSSSSRRILSS
jgi:hypothetical protein